MMISSKVAKLSVLAGIIIVLFILIFGYLFFEPYLTEKEITITVINKEKFGKEPGKYFIFTRDEVFLNANNYYHNKSNADKIYPYFRANADFKVKVVGLYIPFIPRFRNIISIKAINEVEFREPR